jgi:hypothetical protein
MSADTEIIQKIRKLLNEIRDDQGVIVSGIDLTWQGKHLVDMEVTLRDLPWGLRGDVKEVS